MPGSQTLTPSRTSSIGVLSPRFFERFSPSTSASRGFFVTGTGVGPRKVKFKHRLRTFTGQIDKVVINLVAEGTEKTK